MNAFPLYDEEGNIAGAVSVSLDITEVKRLRNEVGNMERISLVGQMAASITHEIRNPMAVIRGCIQLIREKGMLTNDEYAAIIMEEIDRANTIINDFLSLAQNRIVEKKVENLHVIIEQLGPLLIADANMRGHAVRLELSESMSWLPLNEKEIKQLLLNLCRNSLDAMEEKGTLTIATRDHEKEIELIVSDTGVGMTEEVRQKLFEPFFTTKTRGTGLGLAVCLSIVERHNGRIRFVGGRERHDVHDLFSEVLR